MVLIEISSKALKPDVNLNGVVKAPSSTFSTRSSDSLLSKFLVSFNELQSYRNGDPVNVDGQNLSIAAVTAAARYNATIVLDKSELICARVLKSHSVIAKKVEQGTSIYGLSTGFGGSGETSQPLLLGEALLQHQHIGILPSSDTEPLEALPLMDPLGTTSMPESWVRGAMLIRMNSLIRGHSGIRWELIEKINDLLRANITPVVPMRGSISASGDLSPLSYIAGTLTANPSIRVFDGPVVFGHRQMVSSRDALAAHKIEPLTLAPKEPLGILNGTAFSTSVASLALNDAVHVALLAQVCTAMGTEAMLGSRGSYAPFIHSVARPHPGQIEAAQNIWDLLQGSKFAATHEEEVSLEEDKYSLRQDRYPLRTSPQFLGPQIEDILSALAAVTQECNSTTDNPLIDGETAEVHHGGNFQAMAITNAMEKARLSLHHIGKLLFAQSTELLNPTMNNGLPPSMAASDPSLNYHAKGIDIATAAYMSELGFLANPVSTHIQSAEMHNQAINSLALISARATVTSLDVLSMLISCYLYILCQALDLRALRKQFDAELKVIVSEELSLSFGTNEQLDLAAKLRLKMHETLDKTATMDAMDQMREVADSCTSLLVDSLTILTSSFEGPEVLAAIPAFRKNVALRTTKALDGLRKAYLSGDRGGSPALPYLGKTRALYEYIRVKLGVKMHGMENFSGFANGLGSDEVSIGQNISTIYEAIRDGHLQKTVVGMFEA
ncbi:L-Aspartase-like protein [Mycena floridula]|nr:L-Aspartase-like protein [Mycena floridula]